MSYLVANPRLRVGAFVGVFIIAFIYLLILMNRLSFALSKEIDSAPSFSPKPLSTPLEPNMVYLSGGVNSIGCLEQTANCEADERIHKVYIEPFFIGVHEVTNREVVVFLNSIGTHQREQDKQPLLEIKREDQDSHILYENGHYSVEKGYEDYPVVEISWQGASEYARWLNKATGKNYRLPTEAEWEYMARAGASLQDSLDHALLLAQANCDGCTGDWSDADKLMPVGSYVPNAWGIYDVLGNVWEWTCSAYDAQYTGHERECMDSGATDVQVSLRGSSWFNEPWETRLSNRAYQQKWHQDYITGFRLAMPVN